MGMFDSVYVSCPKCGEIVEFQSKAGDCILKSFNSDDVPKEILNDISGDIECCPRCEHVVKIKPEVAIRFIAKAE